MLGLADSFFDDAYTHHFIVFFDALKQAPHQEIDDKILGFVKLSQEVFSPHVTGEEFGNVCFGFAAVKSFLNGFHQPVGEQMLPLKPATSHQASCHVRNRNSVFAVFGIDQDYLFVRLIQPNRLASQRSIFCNIFPKAIIVCHIGTSYKITQAFALFVHYTTLYIKSQ